VGAEDLVRRTAAQYDDEEGLLIQGALRRLAERQAAAMRTCSTCGLPLPLSAFGPDHRATDGLDRRCRSCEAIRRRRARTPTTPSPEEGPS
jgi:hypothetical protein